MANFEKALKKVLKHEGGYVNDPDDRGGETYKGISRNNFPRWEGWSTSDVLKMDPLPPDANYFKGVLDEQAKSFYKEEFWLKMNLDKIQSSLLTEELFDIAVNMGIKKAATFLQQAVNTLNRNENLCADLKVDGVIGPTTVGELNVFLQGNIGEGPDLLVKVLNILQGAYYIDIMTANPVMEKYARGWLKRVNIGKEG